MGYKHVADVMRPVRQQALNCATVSIGIVDPIALDREAPSLVEANGVALSGRCCLETPVIGRAGDDDAANPFENFFTLGQGKTAEVVRQMPGEPASFGCADVASNVMPGG